MESPEEQMFIAGPGDADEYLLNTWAIREGSTMSLDTGAHAERLLVLRLRGRTLGSEEDVHELGITMTRGQAAHLALHLSVVAGVS